MSVARMSYRHSTQRYKRMIYLVSIALFLLLSLAPCTSQDEKATEHEWIVSATVPWYQKKGDNPFSPDLTKEAPLVQLTCYESVPRVLQEREEKRNGKGIDSLEPSARKTKINQRRYHCCHSMYKTIKEEAETLRWGAKIASAVEPTEAKMKRDFLRDCNEQLQPLPDPSDLVLDTIAANSSAYVATEPIARFTLLQVPEGSDIDMRSWSQVVSFHTLSEKIIGNGKNGWAVHWYAKNQVHPLRLPPQVVNMIDTGFKLEMAEEIDVEKMQVPFNVAFSSFFYAAEPDNDTQRYLKHTIDFTIPPTTTSFEVDMLLYIFLPQGVRLSKKDAWKLDSKQPHRPHAVDIDTATSSKGCPKPDLIVEPDFGETSIARIDSLPLRIKLSSSTPHSAQCFFRFYGSTNIVLEDDEPYLIPTPLIHFATFIHGHQRIPWEPMFLRDGSVGLDPPIWCDIDDEKVWGSGSEEL